MACLVNAGSHAVIVRLLLAEQSVSTGDLLPYSWRFADGFWLLSRCCGLCVLPEQMSKTNQEKETQEACLILLQHSRSR